MYKSPTTTGDLIQLFSPAAEPKKPARKLGQGQAILLHINAGMLDVISYGVKKNTKLLLFYIFEVHTYVIPNVSDNVQA